MGLKIKPGLTVSKAITCVLTILRLCSLGFVSIFPLEIFVCLFVLGATPGNTQGSLLALSSGITHGRGPYGVLRVEPRWPSTRQVSYMLYSLSGSSFRNLFIVRVADSILFKV